MQPIMFSNFSNFRNETFLFNSNAKQAPTCYTWIAYANVETNPNPHLMSYI